MVQDATIAYHAYIETLSYEQSAVIEAWDLNSYKQWELIKTEVKDYYLQLDMMTIDPLSDSQHSGSPAPSNSNPGIDEVGSLRVSQQDVQDHAVAPNNDVPYVREWEEMQVLLDKTKRFNVVQDVGFEAEGAHRILQFHTAQTDSLRNSLLELMTRIKGQDLQIETFRNF